MGGAVAGGAAPTSSGQGGSLGLGGLPMAAPVQAAPVGASMPADLNTPTGLQFGTAGVGTGPVQQAPMQQMYRPQPQYQGLQQLLSRMIGGYQQPQRSFQPYQYQNPALSYRPNMAAAQANLGRTATSQAEAAAKAARMKQDAADAEDFTNWQRQQYNAYKFARDNPSYE